MGFCETVLPLEHLVRVNALWWFHVTFYPPTTPLLGPKQATITFLPLWKRTVLGIVRVPAISASNEMNHHLQ